MARKSLRPHLNQIRAWVRQGRTDAWVAHQLEVPVQDITQFKEQNELASEEEASPGGAAEFPEEVDLRAEDDALIAAELEAAALEAERERAAEEERVKAEKEQKAKAAAEKRAKAAAEKRAKAAEEAEEEDGDQDEEDVEGEDEERERGRRRGRRGGRRRKASGRSGAPLEGTFDHGEEGYGLWLDPAIQDDPIYAEHWAGHRPVEVTVEEEQIVIRRIREDS